MDIQDFNKMSLEEIQEFQQKNRAKIEANRKKAKEAKAQTHRWIVRGKLIEDFLPGAADMTDEQFVEKLYELIYK
jgi:hypothetical protein